jgi:hypothetical protein
MKTYRNNVIDLYSRVIEPVGYTEGKEVSFSGSQIQDEFFKAWECIGKFYEKNPTKHISFLEIGAYKGLWALALSEFCKEKELTYDYTTVTYMLQDPNNNPLYEVVKYYEEIGQSFTLINSPSQDKAVLEKLKPSYDIVFIDGDHTYGMVKEDIAIYAPMAEDMLLFHDIRPVFTTPSCGVYEAIQDFDLKLDEQIIVDGDWMGIGIHYV